MAVLPTSSIIHARAVRGPIVLAALVLFLCGTPTVHAQEVARRQAQATRVASGVIRIDGSLDEEVWQKLPALTDFVQMEPVEGAAPTNSMEIKFAFDDDALYVGARMQSSPGTPIQAPLSRRDEGGESEYLQVELDTYLDRRTAYMFGVTAAGVRLDHYHSTDNEGSSDSGFDPVWRADTRIDDAGWTAELWIPFSQLRFIAVDKRVWGLNIKRSIPTLKEEVYWAPVLRTERGWASRFGDLHGIDGIRPRPRLELLPYIAASSRVVGDRDVNNPFESALNPGQAIGADLKIGVGSNLTLDATINPDFGQVEADPAEVNLSAFETFFSERRPFFLEGNNLLHGHVNNYYYSRRIGAVPSGPASGDYVDFPKTTTILGAAKLTGRLASGTSLGLLAAVTGQERARVATAGLQSQVVVAPRTTWGIGRVQQEFGREASTVGAGVILVDRDLEAGNPLSSLMLRRAISGVVDTQLKFGNRTYEAEASIGFSHVTGEAAALERLQRSTVHLFQSPDRKAVSLDPTRTSMTGLNMQVGLDKVAGRHWLWGTNILLESPGFEANDAGRLNYASDIRVSQTRLTYRETVPGRYLRAYSFQSSLDATPYWGWWPRPRWFVVNSANLTFNNFWVARIAYTPTFAGQDIQLTRGGPTMGTPSGWEIEGSLRNRNTATTRWDAELTYRETENGDLFRGGNVSLSFRPSPQWRFSIEPLYNHEIVTRQYVTSVDGGRPETFSRRYVFGVIDRTTMSSQFRVNFTFKPDMTLEVYAEPFAASGRYEEFGELEAARSRNLRVYGESGTTVERSADGKTLVTDGSASFSFTRRDFNVRSFRSNVVIRWEWRPGSTLFAVWQQDRASEEPYGDHVGPRDLFGSFSASGDNIFVIKTTFWIAR
jgi:hypothetical protein